MRFLNIGSALVVVVFSLAAGASPADRKERREDRKENRQERREMRQENREERRDRRQGKKHHKDEHGEKPVTPPPAAVSPSAEPTSAE